jgi:hypothetical protein
MNAIETSKGEIKMKTMANIIVNQINQLGLSAEYQKAIVENDNETVMAIIEIASAEWKKKLDKIALRLHMNPNLKNKFYQDVLNIL